MRVVYSAIAFLILFAIVSETATSQGFCNDGQTRECGSSAGSCMAGTASCVNGSWGECTGGSAPQPEICGNNLDDNCNNIVDECAFSPFLALIGIGIVILIFIWIMSKLT